MDTRSAQQLAYFAIMPCPSGTKKKKYINKNEDADVKFSRQKMCPPMLRRLSRQTDFLLRRLLTFPIIIEPFSLSLLLLLLLRSQRRRWREKVSLFLREKKTVGEGRVGCGSRQLSLLSFPRMKTGKNTFPFLSYDKQIE